MLPTSEAGAYRPPRAWALMIRERPGPAPRERALVTPACGTTPARCEMGDALRLLAKAHVLDTLHLAAHGRPLRFNELRDTLRVTPNVLSIRLKELVDAGLLTRAERDDAVSYEATLAGRALLVAVAPIRDWAREHASAPPVAPVRAQA